MKRTGWYRLGSGLHYYGTIPAGVDECDAPIASTVETMDGQPGPGVQLNDDGTPPVQRPAPTARKGDLIAYVDSLNLDADGRDSTPNRTKAELWALIEAADQNIHPSNSGDDIAADVLVDQGVTDAQQIGEPDQATIDAHAQGGDVEITHGDQG